MINKLYDIIDSINSKVLYINIVTIENGTECEYVYKNNKKDLTIIKEEFTNLDVYQIKTVKQNRVLTLFV